MQIKKKGISQIAFIIISSILAFIVLFLFVNPLRGSVSNLKNTSDTFSSCEGMGFFGGICIARGDTTPCKVKLDGLGCKNPTPVCCFLEGSQAPATSGPVSITSIRFEPQTVTKSASFKVICNTNLMAKGCIYLTVNNGPLSFQSEKWTTTTTGSTTQNQVEFSCTAPRDGGSYVIACKVNDNICNIGSQTEQSANIQVT